MILSEKSNISDLRLDASQSKDKFIVFNGKGPVKYAKFCDEIWSSLYQNKPFSNTTQ
jgi:hypothetical protein